MVPGGRKGVGSVGMCTILAGVFPGIRGHDAERKRVLIYLNSDTLKQPLPVRILKNESPETANEFLQRMLEEFERPLLGYANSILSDVEAARDAVQDTFLKLYQQPVGSIGMGVKSWLFTVCRNRCFDMLRKNRRQSVMDVESLQRIDERAPDPAGMAAKEEAVSEVIRFLDRLPTNQQEVVRLKFHQGLSYKEISNITGLSVSNVGFLLHTGLKRLRKLLAHLGEI